MFKKTLLFLSITAIALSPLMPSANADTKTPVMIDSAWDYGTYQVTRVVTDKNIQGPFEKNGVAYLYAPSTDSKGNLAILKDGNIQTILGVGNQITKPEALIGQSEFVFDIPSAQKDQWTTIVSYDSTTQMTTEKTTLARKANELNLLSYTIEQDRLYGSILATDQKTGEVKSMLFAKDFAGVYDNRDFTFFMNNPMQQIMDVHSGKSLVKMEFPGGNRQLWIMDDRSQKMEAIPNTWTEPGSDIVSPHYLSDGTIVFFQNFRFYSYRPGTDTTPLADREATLNWLASPDTSIQIDGDNMVWVDAKHQLYASTVSGVFNIGSIKDSPFKLVNDTVYFDSTDSDPGYSRGYNLSTRNVVKTSFLVTSEVGDVQVGTTRDGKIWYKNLMSGIEMEIGRGAHPVLSDRLHAYWQGTDKSIYQATFSSVLDLSKASYHAYRSATSPTVYLVKDQSIWTVKDEKTYFTWFDSWKDVKTVNAKTMEAYLSSYQNQGDANFAPGTWVKSVANPRVYIVGNDGALHWIISETVAKTLNGSAWSQKIVDVPDTYLWRYATGKNIQNASTILSI